MRYELRVWGYNKYDEMIYELRGDDLPKEELHHQIMVGRFEAETRNASRTLISIVPVE